MRYVLLNIVNPIHSEVFKRFKLSLINIELQSNRREMFIIQIINYYLFILNWRRRFQGQFQIGF